MSNFLQIPAPAKINLFLHVVGQRQDGYHLLQSVFQLINLSDSISLSRREDKVIRRQNSVSDIPEQRDLVVQAAKLLQTHCKVSLGVDIVVEKHIPMGAGLGGGSSDAASTLLGLNHLWDLGLSTEELGRIGLSLGADVPFFVRGTNAFVEGIGDIIHPISLPKKEFLLVYPGVNIPTKEIFTDSNLTRNHSPITITDFEDNYLINRSIFTNDLQEVAIRKFVEVKNAIEWLERYVPDSQPIMTGSGSSVFCEIPSTLNIHDCLSLLPKNWRGFQIQSLDRHSAYNLISSTNLQKGSRQVG